MADKPFKIILIGDRAVGKTSLLVTYRDGVFPTQYKPADIEIYTKEITLDDNVYTIKIRDYSGFDQYGRIKHLIYPDVSFLIC